MVEALLDDLKRDGHVEDRAAVLDGDHPAGGEALAVSNPVDGVEDRDAGVAGAQEVAVQGVGPPVLWHRAGCGHQRLADDLSAVDRCQPSLGLVAR